MFWKVNLLTISCSNRVAIFRGFGTTFKHVEKNNKIMKGFVFVIKFFDYICSSIILLNKKSHEYLVHR